jgi:hypothetical protein
MQSCTCCTETAAQTGCAAKPHQAAAMQGNCGR